MLWRNNTNKSDEIQGLEDDTTRATTTNIIIANAASLNFNKVEETEKKRERENETKRQKINELNPKWYGKILY